MLLANATTASLRSALIASRLSNHSLLDGCQHVFLDVGANSGMVIRSLYNPRDARHATLQPEFNRAFGPSAEERLRTVCTVAFEPNPIHLPLLASVEAKFRAMNARVTVINAAAAANDGDGAFHRHPAHGPGHSSREWGSSLHNWSVHQKQDQALPVRTFDLARWMEEVVISRRGCGGMSRTVGRGAGGKMHNQADGGIVREGEGARMESVEGRCPGRVILKMDIEGEEWPVVSRLLAFGTLCKLDRALIEFHSVHSGHGKLAASYRVNAAYEDVLHFMLAHAAGTHCKVKVDALTDAKNG